MKTLQTTITRTVIAAAIFTAAILTLGCAKPPTEEMENAVEAVTRAENDNDAATYAASTIDRAKDALAKMQTEADSKRYNEAKSSAAEAIAIAERAIAEGRAGAARARDEAAALISELKPLVAETEQGINAAKAAGLPLDYNSLTRDFDAACSSAEQAETALSDSRYNDSLKLGRAARAGLNTVNQNLSNVVIANTRKK